MKLEEIWPPYAVTITAGDLSLRVVQGARRGQLAQLQRLVRAPNDFDRGDDPIMITGAEQLRNHLRLTDKRRAVAT